MSGFDFDLQAKYIWCYNIESINMLLTYSSACRIKTWDSSFYSWSRLVIFGSTESCYLFIQSESVGAHLVGCVDVLWATNKNNLCLLIGVLDSVRGEHSISTVAPLRSQNDERLSSCELINAFARKILTSCWMGYLKHWINRRSRFCDFFRILRIF